MTVSATVVTMAVPPAAVVDVAIAAAALAMIAAEAIVVRLQCLQLHLHCPTHRLCSCSVKVLHVFHVLLHLLHGGNNVFLSAGGCFPYESSVSDSARITRCDSVAANRGGWQI